LAVRAESVWLRSANPTVTLTLVADSRAGAVLACGEGIKAMWVIAPCRWCGAPSVTTTRDRDRWPVCDEHRSGRPSQASTVPPTCSRPTVVVEEMTAVEMPLVPEIDECEVVERVVPRVEGSEAFDARMRAQAAVVNTSPVFAQVAEVCEEAVNATVETVKPRVRRVSPEERREKKRASDAKSAKNKRAKLRKQHRCGGGCGRIVRALSPVPSRRENGELRYYCAVCVKAQKARHRELRVVKKAKKREEKLRDEALLRDAKAQIERRRMEQLRIEAGLDPLIVSTNPRVARMQIAKAAKQPLPTLRIEI
jgi:hypothetical protein